ncbi:hypothetical protein F4825DRAFT_426286 [Nemania diffusa]|nr:hypothetical protein F4825DRAFT_426286 [Nemania diffusa]
MPGAARSVRKNMALAGRDERVWPLGLGAAGIVRNAFSTRSRTMTRLDWALYMPPPSQDIDDLIDWLMGGVVVCCGVVCTYIAVFTAYTYDLEHFQTLAYLHIQHTYTTTYTCIRILPRLLPTHSVIKKWLLRLLLLSIIARANSIILPWCGDLP